MLAPNNRHSGSEPETEDLDMLRKDQAEALGTWHRYRTIVNRNKVIELFMPVINYTIYRFLELKKSPLNHDELLGYGFEGSLKALRTFKPDQGEFPYWLYRCVFSTLQNAVREYHDKKARKKRQGVSYVEDIGELAVSSREAGFKKIERREKVRRVREAIQKLPVKQAIACEEMFLFGNTRDETAKKLRVSNTQVSNLCRSAIGHLRFALAEK